LEHQDPPEADELIFPQNVEDAGGDEVPQPNDDEGDAPRGLHKYSERYVLFIDILGFKSLIHKSRSKGQEENIVSRIVNVLSLDRGAISDGYYQSRNVDKRSEPVFHTFSDFIVGSVEVSPHGLDCLLFAAWHITEDLLSKGLISRGGLAKGQVVFQATDEIRSGFIFGPAFNEAYLLESTIANFPRIVLSREVRKDFESTIKTKSGFWGTELIRKCDDGPSCIDLFAAFRSESFLGGLGSPTDPAKLALIINENLDENDDNPRVYEKIQWLARRFIDAVSSRNYLAAKAVVDKLAS